MYSCCRARSAPVPERCLCVCVCVCVCTLVPEYPRRTSTHSVSLKCHLLLLLSDRPLCRLALCILKNGLTFSPLPVFLCYFLRMFSAAMSCVFFQICKFSRPSSGQNWTGSSQQAGFGHLQFRRADNFWICQIAFHFSTQYPKGLGHFFIFYFLCPNRSFFFSLPETLLILCNCHWIHCSFFWQPSAEAGMKKYYRITSTPLAWCTAFVDTFSGVNAEWHFISFFFFF